MKYPMARATSRRPANSSRERTYSYSFWGSVGRGASVTPRPLSFKTTGPIMGRPSAIADGSRRFSRGVLVRQYAQRRRGGAGAGRAFTAPHRALGRRVPGGLGRPGPDPSDRPRLAAADRRTGRVDVAAACRPHLAGPADPRGRTTVRRALRGRLPAHRVAMAPAPGGGRRQRPDRAAGP